MLELYFHVPKSLFCMLGLWLPIAHVPFANVASYIADNLQCSDSLHASQLVALEADTLFYFFLSPVHKSSSAYSVMHGIFARVHKMDDSS